MALRTRGIVTQVAKETTFNTAPTFSDTDTIITEKADLAPKVDKVDRKALSCSIIKESGIPVRFTAEGSISVEIDVKSGTNDFYGSVLYEAGLGFREAPGTGVGALIGYESDGTTAADKISKPDSSVNGTATLYTVADGLPKISLAVRKFYDSGDVVMQTTGNVINQVDLNFPQADILTAAFGIEAANYTTLTGLTKPACSTTGEVPFVGKNAKFKFDGNAVDAKNLAVTIKNTITNFESITTEGYTDKEIVEKEISGSFVVLLEDMSYIDKLRNQTIGEFYLEIANGSEKLAVYMPSVLVTDVAINDDSSRLIECSVNFMAQKDSTVGEAFMLACQG